MIMSLPIYLDNAATTAVDPRVVQCMLDCLQGSDGPGNASSTSHVFGRRAHARVEAARAELATLLGCDPREIVWTSGATEADNLALRGAALAGRRRGRHIVTCRSEHKAVLDTCRALAREGWEISFLPPQADGLVSAEQIAAVLRDDTVLVSLMAVNNETGVVQDLTAIGALCRARGVLFHVDAAQALGRIALAPAAMNVDLMSLSAHKCHGPQGIGALYVRRLPKVHIEPLLHGGGQERGLRAGTLPVHQLVGMAEAARLAVAALPTESARQRALAERLWRGLQPLGDVVRHGHAERRVGGILNVGFAGVHGASLLAALPGLAVATGSACTSALDEPSHVLTAMGVDAELAAASIRFSFSRLTTAAEIDAAVAQIVPAVRRLRALSPFAASAEGADRTGACADERALFARHFAQPFHAGGFAVTEADVVMGGVRAAGAVFALQLQADGERITRAHFRAFGAPALIAVGSWLCQWLAGRPLAEARALTHREPTQALLLEPREYTCAVLACETLAAALARIDRSSTAALRQES